MKIKPPPSQGFVFFALFSRIFAALLLILPLMLVLQSWPALQSQGLKELLFAPYNPLSGEGGLFSFFLSSVFLALSAFLPALIMGLSLALKIYAKPESRFFKSLEHLIRALAGVPTVIYGLAGILTLIPLLRKAGFPGTGLSLFTAALPLSLLILPTFALNALRAFRNLSASERQTVLALGSSPEAFELFYLLPRCKKDLMGAGFLTLARALSDTLIALMLSGNVFLTPKSPFSPGRTLTTHTALTLPGNFDGHELSAAFFGILILLILVSVLSLAGLKKGLSS